MDEHAIDGDWFVAWLRAFAETIAANVEELTALDAAIGDADHGTNMQRGLTAVLAILPDADPGDRPPQPADLLKQTAMTLINTVGGASGPLYGTFFLRFAAALGNGAVTAQDFGRALRAGVAGVMARGKAEVGDKTMVDAWLPACDAFDRALPAGLDAALTASADAAERGRDATFDLVARKGRASYLGPRSAGHLDPGATSTAMLLRCAQQTPIERRDPDEPEHR